MFIIKTFLCFSFVCACILFLTHGSSALPQEDGVGEDSVGTSDYDNAQCLKYEQCCRSQEACAGCPTGAGEQVAAGVCPSQWRCPGYPGNVLERNRVYACLKSAEQCCDRDGDCYGCPHDRERVPTAQCQSRRACQQNWKWGLRFFDDIVGQPTSSRNLPPLRGQVPVVSPKFWGWNRPMSVSDVEGFLREYIYTRDAPANQPEILIFSGTHGDDNGRFNADSLPQEGLNDARFKAQDEALVARLAQEFPQRGWQITVRSEADFEGGDGFEQNLLVYLQRRGMRFVIWAFCNSAAGNADTMSVTIRATARSLYGFGNTRAVNWHVPNIQQRLNANIQDFTD